MIYDLIGIIGGSLLILFFAMPFILLAYILSKD
jgi:hypothetical protein